MTSPEPLPRTADGQWQHVHPLTPAVRSWQALVFVLFVIVQDVGQQAFRGGGDDGGPSGGGPGLPDLAPDLLFGGTAVVAVLLAVVIGFAVLSWRMTRFRLTAEALELHQGVLFRQQRAARLDRLQAVDVVQPLVARVFGLARLSLEVAGAGDSKVELAYLSLDRAQSLRRHLLARAAGLAYHTEEAPEAPEHAVFELPIERLLGSLLLSAPFLVAVVGLFGLTAGSVLVGSPGPAIGGVLPFVLGVGGVLWSRFSGGFGFRVATSPDGVRLRHGLLEQRTQTVPPGRVQAVRLEQPLLWRAVDWWRVRVNVAGYGAGENAEGESSTTMLPVASRDEALLVLAMVVPDVGVAPPEQPRAVIEAALSGDGPAGGFVTCPPIARRLDPLSWRRNGYRSTGTVLLVRRGWLDRRLDVVPHARTQSLGVRQGPVQRRLGLATFAVHSTPGPVTPVVAHLSSDEAARLLAEQSERSRAARRSAGPERWMHDAVPDAPPPTGPPVSPPVSPSAVPGPAGPPPGAAS